MTSENSVLIALDIHALEDEIEYHLSEGEGYDREKLGKVTREHMETAMERCSIPDEFYEAFDRLRSQLIEAAIEEANK